MTTALQNVLARSSYADPVLLLPRGFDPATSRFRYDVNPRFGSNRAGRSIGRDPFRVVIDFSVNLSVDFDVQELRRAVEPVRMDGRWQRRTADSIASFYLSNTSSVHKLLLAESDSLFLSATQITMLRRADSVYSERVRALYKPIGEGDVCFNCLLAGADGIRQRAQAAADHAKAGAVAAQEFADELKAEEITVPDMAAVEEMRDAACVERFGVTRAELPEPYPRRAGVFD